MTKPAFIFATMAIGLIVVHSASANSSNWPSLDNPPQDWERMTLTRLSEYLSKYPVNARDTVSVTMRRGSTALLYAARYSNDPGIIEQLIEAGADLEARNEGGNTALLYAATSRHENIEVMKALLRAGANIHAKAQYGLNALHRAVYSNSNPEFLSVLMNAGLGLNERDQFNRTPLMIAAGNNRHVAMFSALLELTSAEDLEARDTVFGFTPLQWAAFQGTSSDVVMTMLDAGANPHANSREGTAWELIQGNTFLQDTEAYWRLNDLRFQ